MRRLLLLSFLALSPACHFDPKTAVLEVNVRVAEKSAPLTDVYVIAGGDKRYWPALAPGSAVKDTVRVPKNEPVELTVLYKKLGVDTSWTRSLAAARTQPVTLQLSSEADPVLQ
jgi:hypothetical protein